MNRELIRTIDIASKLISQICLYSIATEEEYWNLMRSICKMQTALDSLKDLLGREQYETTYEFTKLESEKND